MKGAVPPGFLLAGTASGVGKTVTAIGLIRALRDLGLTVRAAKTGPDFIDTAFLAAASGAPAANLDGWMCSPGRQRCPRAVPHGLDRVRRRLLAPQGGNPPDLWVVEGAMGLYDGGHGGMGGAAHLAALLDLPVLLVLDVRGMGQSVAALAEGFLHHTPATGRPRFLGILCTHSGGSSHERLLRAALTPLLREKSLYLAGFLPCADAPRLPSRHLGLVEAREALTGMDLDGIGRWFAAHCDMAGLLRTLGIPMPSRAPAPLPDTATKTGAVDNDATACPAPATVFFPFRRHSAGRPRIGIAHDTAFSFCYADLPPLLAELGAEPVFFSPLADAAPPPNCAGLYFPGGYPELHAEALMANTSMLDALRAQAALGVPVYAECGGYIYLMRELEAHGNLYALAGLLPLSCRLDDRLAALGYREATPEPGWLPAASAPSGTPLTVRGHEFHYARLTSVPLPPGCAPLWHIRDSASQERAPEGCRLGLVAGSWLHLYPEGSRRFWKAWLALAQAVRARTFASQRPTSPRPRSTHASRP